MLRSKEIYRIQLLTTFMVISALQLFGQNICGEHTFRKVGKDLGLISSRIYSVFEDDRGQLYAGTDKGLFKFDGHSFQLLGKKDNLRANFIYSFHTDSRGRTWLFSYNSTIHYIQNDSIYHLPISEDLRSSSTLSYQLGFAEASDGTIYIGSQASGYVTIDDNLIARRHDFLPGEDRVNIILPFDGDVIMGNSEKLVLSYDLDSIVAIDFFKSKTPQVSNYALSPEHIYIGKKDQLKKLDRKTLKVDEEYSLTNKEIIHLSHIDGEILIGTHDGLYTLVNEIFVPHSFNEVLNGIGVSYILKNHIGEYVVSTLEEGLYVFSKTHFICDKRLPIGRYMEIVKDSGDLALSLLNGPTYWLAQSGNLTTISTDIDKQEDQYLTNIFKIGVDTFYTYRHSIYVKSPNRDYQLNISARKVHYDEPHDRFILAMYNRILVVSRDALLSVFDSNKVDKTREAIDFIEKHTIATVNSYDVTSFNKQIIISGEENLYKLQGDILKQARAYKGTARKLLNINNEFLGVATFNQGVHILDTAFTLVFKIDPDDTDACSPFIKSMIYDQQSEVIYMLHDNGYSHCAKEDWDNVTCSSLSSVSNTLSLADMVVEGEKLFFSSNQTLISIDKTKANEVDSFCLNIKALNVEKGKNTNSYITKLEDVTFSMSPMILDGKASITYLYTVNSREEYKSRDGIVRIDKLKPGRNTIDIRAYSTTGLDSGTERIYINYNLPWHKNRTLLAIFFLVISGVLFAGYRKEIIVFNADVFRKLVVKYTSKFARPTYIIIKLTDGNYQKIDTNALLYVKASGNYLELVTDDKSYLTRSTLKAFAAKTTSEYPNLIQIHRSYMANKNFIDTISLKKVFINEHELPYTETFKSSLEEFRKL